MQKLSNSTCYWYISTCKGRFKFPNNKLTTIAAELGVPVSPDAHRAFADVDMTVKVLQIMIERIREQGHAVQTIKKISCRIAVQNS